MSRLSKLPGKVLKSATRTMRCLMLFAALVHGYELPVASFRFSSSSRRVPSLPKMSSTQSEALAAAAVIRTLETELSAAKADAWNARCEAREANEALEAAHATITELRSALDSMDGTVTPAKQDASPEEAEAAASSVFSTFDDNGDGVLSREEFRKGYALLTSDKAFDKIDVNSDGELTLEEFTKGCALEPLLYPSCPSSASPPPSPPFLYCYCLSRRLHSTDAILVSDSARAAAEREKVEQAVEAERVRATKEAAKVLAEAELMDILNKPIMDIIKQPTGGRDSAAPTNNASPAGPSERRGGRRGRSGRGGRGRGRSNVQS